MELVAVPLPPPEKRARDAAELRRLADKVECGDIRDFAFVADDSSEKHYVSFISFDDRWRMLAALEYARAGVRNCD